LMDSLWCCTCNLSDENDFWFNRCMYILTVVKMYFVLKGLKKPAFAGMGMGGLSGKVALPGN